MAAPAADNPAITTLARANPSDGTQFVYVRQADATSTATVSTHLALNADQAAGYTYDDADPALTYTGTWTHASTSNANYTAGDYDSTESWSTQAGASMTVTFTGTAVQWIGPKNNNGGIADVSIDGTQVATVDTYAAAGKEFQQVLFSQTGLSAGSHTLTITATGNQNAASSADTVVIDAINVPTAAQQADYYPAVPQSGTLTLDGRDARLLVANYDFGAGEHLVYSTSELMTQGDIGGQATAVLYDPDGTDGETVLRYASQPAVNVVSGSVQSSWDASRGDLRLDYTHHGLAEVQISGGGAPPLRLLIASTDVAEELWPESTESSGTTAAGDVLVQGGYLVRTATVHGSDLALTGDTSQSGPLTVWAPRRGALGELERPPGRGHGRSGRRADRHGARAGPGAPAHADRLAVQHRDPGSPAGLRRQLVDAGRPSGIERLLARPPRCCTPATTATSTASPGTAGTSRPPATRPASS